MGICDLFFSTLRSVGRAFVCVEVQSLIDPVVLRRCVLAGGESPADNSGLFWACVYFYQSACGWLTDEIPKLPFNAKIGTHHSVGT